MSCRVSLTQRVVICSVSCLWGGFVCLEAHINPPNFFMPPLTVNDSQPASRQREIPIMSDMPRPTLADASLVKACKSRMDAIVLCVQLSHYSHEAIAEMLSIDKGHWSRIMQGRAHFPDAKSVKLMELCGNYAPMQYEAMACGFELLDKSLLKALRAAA